MWHEIWLSDCSLILNINKIKQRNLSKQRKTTCLATMENSCGKRHSWVITHWYWIWFIIMQAFMAKWLQICCISRFLFLFFWFIYGEFVSLIWITFPTLNPFLLYLRIKFTYANKILIYICLIQLTMPYWLMSY